jgi:hypothetical protein
MSAVLSCFHCGAVVFDFTLHDDEFDVVLRALRNGSKTIATTELKYFAQCTDEMAAAWIDHLLSCAYAWPNANIDRDILQLIDSAFADVEKPEHFTHYDHCDECQTHNDTLRSRNRETLRRQDLGSAGWDPMAFSCAQGLGYFFRQLARFALLPDVWRDHDWYGDQLLSHLYWDGPENHFLAWCSQGQRNAVHALLQHLSITRAKPIEHHQLQGELRMALSTWQDDKDPDAMVLLEMEKIGADLSKPHEPDFAFEAAEESKAKALADELRALGYNVELYEPDDDNPNFQVAAKRSMVLDLKVLNRLTLEFEALAEKHNASYNGWGAEIVE